MGIAKSQFVGGSQGGGYGLDSYLGDSLSVMTARTSGGIDSATAAKLDAMQNFASGNPDVVSAVRLVGYVERLAAASETKPQAAAPVARAKPGTGSPFG